MAGVARVQARCIDLFFGDGSCYMNVADVLYALSDQYSEAEREHLRDLLTSVLNVDADPVMRMN